LFFLEESKQAVESDVPLDIITGHLEDKSFQTIDITSTDNQSVNNKDKYKKNWSMDTAYGTLHLLDSLLTAWSFCLLDTSLTGHFA